MQAAKGAAVPDSVPRRPAARAWEGERAKRLHAVCIRLAARFAASPRGITKVWKREARRLDGKPYRTAPTRRWKMSASRLSTLFYLWRRRGRTPSVFQIRYDRCSHPLVTGDFIRALAIQCSAPGVGSIREGYDRLATRRAVRGGRPPIKYSTAIHYLPREKWCEVRDAHLRLAQAEQDLGRAVAQFQVAALARVPTKRTRVRPLNFEI